MSYLQDMSGYSYTFKAKPGVLAWGWLAVGYSEPPGGPMTVNPFFVESVSIAPVISRYRGVHSCPWCKAPDSASGNGEVWFVGRSGKVYSAPALVAHYMRDHGYVPPQQVLEDFDGHFLPASTTTQDLVNAYSSGEPTRPPQVRDTAYDHKCALCHGTGKIKVPSEMFPGVVRTHVCTLCHGTGSDV